MGKKKFNPYHFLYEFHNISSCDFHYDALQYNETISNEIKYLI